MPIPHSFPVTFDKVPMRALLVWHLDGENKQDGYMKISENQMKYIYTTNPNLEDRVGEIVTLDMNGFQKDCLFVYLY